MQFYFQIRKYWLKNSFEEILKVDTVIIKNKITANTLEKLKATKSQPKKEKKGKK